MKDVVEAGKERDWDPTATEYIVICRPERADEIKTWFPDEEDGGRVKHLVNTVNSRLVTPELIWTDDRNAEINVLNLGRFLFE